MVAEETVLGGLSVLANSFPEICKDKVKAVYLDFVEREFFKRNSFKKRRARISCGIFTARDPGF